MATSPSFETKQRPAEKWNRSLFILFQIVLSIGGVAALYSKFFDPSALFSATSPKWMIVLLFYFITLFFFFFLLNPQIQPVPWIRFNSTISKYFQAKAVWNFALSIFILVGMGWLLLFTPANRIFFFGLNSFFLNYPLTVLVTSKISFLLGTDKPILITKKELLVGFFLYLAYFGLGLNLIFYPFVLIFIILMTTTIVCLATIRPDLSKFFTWFGSVVERYPPTFPLLLLLFAYSLFYFLSRSIQGALTLPSIMDEGAYAIKGLLFATGKFTPYQDFGPWTNKMPLAFLLPGWIKQFFGRGIETIRVASFVMQIVVLILLYLTGERLRKPFGGMLAVVLFVLNPALQNFYSLGNSQILSILLLTISLYFSLASERSIHFLMIGNIFAALLLLTRENMAPYYVFLNIYLIWKVGFKRSILPIAAGMLVILVGHWMYWPGILKIWAKWVPKSLSPYLDSYRYSGGGTLMWKIPGKTAETLTVLTSFVQGINSNFVAIFSLSALPLLFTKWEKIKGHVFFKEFIFVATTLLVLVFSHGVITLNDGSCIFCFSSYLAFFLPLGILFFVLCLNFINQVSTIGRAILLALTGLFYYLATLFNHRQTLNSLLYIKLPSATSASGFQALFITIEQVFNLKPDHSQIFFPILFGSIIYLVIIYLTFQWFNTLQKHGFTSVHLYSVMLVVVLGSILITDLSLNTNFDQNRCENNVIQAHQTVDIELKQVLPEGSKIYWLGESTTPFLTLNVNLFPQQINDGFSYKQGSEDDSAEKYGFWNANLAKKWSEEADYLMIEERYMNNPILDNVSLKDLHKITTTSPLNPCDTTSRYIIFEK